MGYFLYKLEFTTGLHIGRDKGGASLDDSRMTIHSDTLFSALCCECANARDIERLHKYFSEDILAISDTFPYQGDEYFLPKPILYIGNFKREGNPETRKEMKSIEYIPLSAFDRYLKGLSGFEVALEDFKFDFGGTAAYTRVAIKDHPQPMPYHVGYWRFAKDSGLYFIVHSQNQRALSFFEDLISSLGLSGIGGKQSSGLGKFNIEKVSVPPKLQELLEDKDANYHMLLGTALPNDEALEETLSDGWYTFIRRGGFVRSDSYSQRQLKKRTIYMLSPGSCLKTRFTGEIFDLSDGGSHPVWRCGKTLFMGVRL